MIKRATAAIAAVALLGGVLAPGAAAESQDTLDQLLETVGLSQEDLPPELVEEISDKVDELVDDGVIDEEKVDEVAELPEEEREELIRERANHSHGLAHAVVRFLGANGVETETGEIKDALAEFLADYMAENGLTLAEDETDEGDDGDGLNLRKIFIMYLEDEGEIEVTQGKLRQALVENGYGPTPEEAEARRAEREERTAERDARRDERRADRAEDRGENRNERADERKDRREDRRERRSGGDGSGDDGVEDAPLPPDDETDIPEPPKLEEPDTPTDEERMPDDGVEDTPEPDTSVPGGES